MRSLKKVLTLTLAIAFALQFMFLLTCHMASGSFTDFFVINVNVRSSADTPYVYPGSRRVNLKVEAAYQNSKTSRNVVGWLNITVEGISFSSRSGACSPARLLNGTVAEEVGLNTHVTFEYLIDISSSVKPDTYVLKINITYVKENRITFEVHPIAITVSPYPEVSLRVVDAYFSPAAHPGSVDTNLYVILENNGSSTISSANFNITLPEGFTVKNPRASIGIVSVGDRFTITFTGVSLPLDAQLGAYFATIYADYNARTEDGVAYSTKTSFNVMVVVESPPPEEPIMVAAVNTLYNGDFGPIIQSAKGVVLRIHLINRLPDTISAMIINATLPEGITMRGISGTYINGMRPGGSCFVDLTVDVDPEMALGKHTCSLDICYLRIVSSSSFLTKQNLKFQINVESRHSVIDDNAAIEIVDLRWYEGSVGPNTYGAHLLILVRNVYIDGLHGAVLELNLPEGIYNSADNSSCVKTAPLSVQLQPPRPLQVQDLAEILNAFLSARIASPAQVFGRGDIITFMVSLNIFDVKVGNYTFNGRLSYIDAWGGKREISLTIPVAVLGRAGYIEVSIDKSVSVRRRFVNIPLTLTNRGSTPMYDVYIVVSPYQGTPILIVSPAVNYVEKINSKEVCVLPLTLAYNPLSFYTQAGASSYITYGPVPLMVSVFYRDASGYYRTFNNTVTVIVEPFIELAIRNIRAIGTNMFSSVTGTLVNYGSSTAYRVEVEVKIGDVVASENVGDIGPGEEVVFRVDVSKYDSTAKLAVWYYNIFNERESKEIDITVRLREEAAPPAARGEEWTVERWVIVAGVMVFLAVAIILIYRMMKKTKLVESSPA